MQMLLVMLSESGTRVYTKACRGTAGFDAGVEYRPRLGYWALDECVAHLYGDRQTKESCVFVFSLVIFDRRAILMSNVDDLKM
jgi:hypothetical protein